MIPLLAPAGRRVMRLIGPDFTSPRLTTIRSHSPSDGFATGDPGGVLTPYPQNAPRSVGTPAARVYEPQETQIVFRPAAFGAAAGTPGALPANLSLIPLGGLTQSVPAVDTGPRALWFDLRLSGSATQGGTSLGPSGILANSASPGQTYVGLWRLALVAGSLAGVTEVSMVIEALDAGNAVLAFQKINAAPTLSAVEQNFKTPVLTCPASTTQVRAYLVIGMTNGAAQDLTLRVGPRNVFQGTAGYSLIVPGSGGTGAIVRGLDVDTATLSSLGVPSSGACTQLAKFCFYASAPNNDALQIDDGNSGRRIILLRQNNGVVILHADGHAGVTAATGIAPDQIIRAAVAVYPDGSCAASVNGAAAVTNAVAGGFTSGRTRYRPAPTMGGIIHWLSVRPPIAVSALPALCAAIP